MLDRELDRLVESYGIGAVSSALSAIRQKAKNPSLVIIPNAGSHPVPAAIESLGEIWAASSGALDLASADRARSSYVAVLESIVRKLSADSYGVIYILPFGPATLVAQVKALVYRLLHVTTIDLLHNNGRYFEMDIDLRELIACIAHEEN